MHKRQLYFLIGIILFIGILIYGARAIMEPSYGGSSLSKWLGTGFISQNDKVAFSNAVWHIGPDAVPYLIQCIKKPDLPSPLPRPLVKCAQYLVGSSNVQHYLVNRILQVKISKANTLLVFEILGPKAETAIPELSQLLQQTNIPYAAIYALAYIGEKGLAPILPILTNGNSRSCEAAFSALGNMGTNASQAIPALLSCLQSTNIDTVCSAIGTLCRLHLQPEVVVPILQAKLKDPIPRIRETTVVNLIIYRQEARNALADVQQLLNDPDPLIRRSATNFLQRLDGIQ
jgi:hypothetical protein